MFTNRTHGGGYRKSRFNIHQRIWIITVFVLILSLMVGYAVMDNTFEINGTSKITATTLIRITSIKHVDSNAIGEGKVEGNIKGILPTEFSRNGSTSYQVTVKNEGSTSGILSTINLINESNNKNPSCITMEIEGLQVGDILTPSQEQTFTVTVTNTCGNSGSKENEFSLSYIPVNGEGDTTTIDEKINLLQTQINSLQEENKKLKEDMFSTPIGEFTLFNQKKNFNENENGEIGFSYSALSYLVTMYPLRSGYNRRYKLVLDYSTSDIGNDVDLVVSARKISSTDPFVEYHTYEFHNIWGSTTASTIVIYDDNFIFPIGGQTHLSFSISNHTIGTIVINRIYVLVYDTPQ
ncbi:MAG TPA: hypothetical protein IAB58_05385 [Candidatus Pelethosoma merdigallinarum]|nr:hypothetical protein [Candidatus Pelethosoma merdigallinarum]